ncbi:MULTISPECIES: outer membrane beta-barrel protein [Vibrio]|uniref:outer membrane beta-barrel protein n=1 Tax=Vibrio TaxID=662 RepID=UPI0022CD6719|nr:outer membrane beta-barrel protein [Vibrio sp. Makdt]MDA0155957.1 outer membrane beta-barrel protein [Vibrio sp. Makdt]
MQIKTVKLLSLGALAATATFGARAENTYDSFIGIDAGTHVSGKIELENNEGFNESLDTKASVIMGLSGGVIINDHHRVKLGLAYNGLDDKVEDVVNRADLTASYDYLLAIGSKLNWTVGAHMGYEFFESEADDNDGAIYGVQTGLDYKWTKNWSLGSEIVYTAHHKEEFKSGDFEASLHIKDDVKLMANVQYHF